MKPGRWVVAALLAASCGSGEPHLGADGSAGADTSLAADAGAAADAEGAEGQCLVQTATTPDEGAEHVAACAPVTYRTKPPASGTHYPNWPVFRVYDKPVPWGYLVHGLEHGAVVISYNCPDGCAAEVDAAKAMLAQVAPKRGCTRPSVILAPDPTLDVRFAASAWQQILRATCFDRARFAQFVQEHVDKRGPEAGFEGDCGAVDLEARGWCGAGGS